MALVKYNNNSLSAITAASSLTTGAMTLIKEQTASSSSTISFVHGTSDVVLDGTYPIYVFKLISIHPSAEADLQFQGNAAGGSGYNETITSTAFRAFHFEDDSNTSLAYRGDIDQAQGTSFQTLIEKLGNGNDESGSGFLRIFNPSSTTFVKHFIAQTNEYNSENVTVTNFVSGYFNTASAIDEIQFKMDSGNIDAGDICLYGIN